MKTLIIDTSSKYLVLAIYDNDVLLEAIQEEGNSRQSENTIPYLDQLLKRNNLEIFDIDEIIVTIGPGSYTGERVGLTIVKTLKTIHPFIVKTVSSLLANAGKEKCVSILDARSKMLYLGVYENGKAIIDETMISMCDFEQFMKDYQDYKVVGESDLVNREKIESVIYQNIYDIKDILKEVETIHTVIPNYIKEVEAKRNVH